LNFLQLHANTRISDRAVLGGAGAVCLATHQPVNLPDQPGARGRAPRRSSVPLDAVESRATAGAQCRVRLSVAQLRSRLGWPAA
jgi:hypothetical protein